MVFQLNLCGLLMLGLAGLHGVFPRYFQWKRELAPLSLMNRQMMVIHTFFIALTVGLMGVLCLGSAGMLLQPGLGKRIVWGMLIFWSARFVLQFFGYSARLWKGKRFETLAHLGFSLLWAYFVVVFVLAVRA
jgi:hypothetical protein